MPLRIGVLIIGSLYWRNDDRTRWRRKRLRLDCQWRVRVPIRYGRLSKDGFYTMVFAELPDDQFGHAVVIECQRTLTSASDLIAEAEWLWAAETNSVPRFCFSSPAHSISKEWGCVALLKNPKTEIPQGLLSGWVKRVSEENADREKHLVDPGGMLHVSWPVLADGSGDVGLDLVLATSNNPLPQRNSYPTADVIASAFRAKGTYFRRNSENGIDTFQDSEIEQLLENPHKKA